MWRQVRHEPPLLRSQSVLLGQMPRRLQRPLGAFERTPALPLPSPLKEIGHASLHLLRHALLLAVALPKRMAANKVIGGYTL
jgi:hypothetical protein